MLTKGKHSEYRTFNSIALATSVSLMPLSLFYLETEKETEKTFDKKKNQNLKIKKSVERPLISVSLMLVRRFTERTLYIMIRRFLDKPAVTYPPFLFPLTYRCVHLHVSVLLVPFAPILSDLVFRRYFRS